jgi:carboxyl-terminal processing protease
VIKLGDGSGLKLTVARYYTPNGVSIQAEGIHPDIVVDDIDLSTISKATSKSNSTREGDIAGHLKGEKEKASQKLDIKYDEDESGINWWKEIASKKEDGLSPREKLLRADYQAFQAFSYLKAWKTMKGLTR